MTLNTSIEWARHPETGRGASWNPVLARRLDTGKVGYHCEHASPGCINCYAETFNGRQLPHRGTGLPFKPGHRRDVEIFIEPMMLLAPLTWKAPRGIFVCSMTDLFGEFVPDELIDQVFAVAALCPQHVFMVLTKRPHRARQYLEQTTAPGRIWAHIGQIGARAGMALPAVTDAMNLLGKPLPNVWLGTSVEDQRRADERVPHLLQAPAAVRFLSVEPLIGPVDLTNLDVGGGLRWNALGRRAGLGWCIVGGESGPGARPMHPDWARSLRDSCFAARVPFFFKQWGSFVPQYDADIDPFYWNAQPAEFPDHAVNGGWCFGRQTDQRPWMMFKRDKKSAGRLLDGVEHNEFPAVTA